MQFNKEKDLRIIFRALGIRDRYSDQRILASSVFPDLCS